MENNSKEIDNLIKKSKELGCDTTIINLDKSSTCTMDVLTAGPHAKSEDSAMKRLEGIFDCLNDFSAPFEKLYHQIFARIYAEKILKDIPLSGYSEEQNREIEKLCQSFIKMFDEEYLNTKPLSFLEIIHLVYAMETDMFDAFSYIPECLSLNQKEKELRNILDTTNAFIPGYAQSYAECVLPRISRKNSEWMHRAENILTEYLQNPSF